MPYGGEVDARNATDLMSVKMVAGVPTDLSSSHSSVYTRVDPR